jgi:hypothetical protein
MKVEPMSDKYYENKFEYPLMKLIRQIAEEKDISYHDAALLAIPEYDKTIHWGDEAYELSIIKKNVEEVKTEEPTWQELKKTFRKEG